jgi:hypothetical protein
MSLIVADSFKLAGPQLATKMQPFKHVKPQAEVADSVKD